MMARNCWCHGLAASCPYRRRSLTIFDCYPEAPCNKPTVYHRVTNEDHEKKRRDRWSIDAAPFLPLSSKTLGDYDREAPQYWPTMQSTCHLVKLEGRPHDVGLTSDAS